MSADRSKNNVDGFVCKSIAMASTSLPSHAAKIGGKVMDNVEERKSSGEYEIKRQNSEIRLGFEINLITTKGAICDLNGATNA